MENVKVPENKNLTPDGSFKTKDGRTTYLVSVFFLITIAQKPLKAR